MDTLRDPWTEIRRLQASVLSLQSQLAQIHAKRPPASVLPQQVRWAVTTEAYGTPWPEVAANAFPIRFIDPHFTATQGSQDMEHSARSSEPVAMALSPADWIPPDLPLPVFEQKGLGPSDAGVYWFLDPPRWYIVKLLGDLIQGGSAPASVWWWNATDELVELDCSLIVWDFQLSEPDLTLPSGTFGSVDWYFDRWAYRTSACGPLVY